ncbi:MULTISPECIES: protein-L-isoaspartate O-methyltransferase family protein [Novosphingobium]|uniref:Protein-L-isoaspartate O-methyltransferase n=1 Tax=Novosphingobium decolorationis TaxID=2698673 RepID=A0ABX8E643_9SPHN|nr:MULTISPECIES: protein-L-isoaspartate O-methyltransferase [Novosphingobium]QVM84474.1 protein-L-isoaspartate O-methyltransferase [Novosphingobium decolorationis]GAM04572.1 protein-L-isoaspartate O-methyltransferase [Novosphingobium sp. MBES04]
MTLTEDRSATAPNEARRAMISSQLRTSGVNEPWVLTAMASVAREDFVPADWKDAAYIDRAVPLGEGRFLAAPLFYGAALTEADPTQAKKILLVGDANGYYAALLRTLVAEFDTITPAQALEAGQGGYDLILVDGAAEELPEALVARLDDEGRVVTGEILRGVSRLAVGVKTAGHLALLPVHEQGIPAVPEFAAPKRWSF